MKTLDDAGCKLVDEALKDWRQGDCVIGEQWFLFRANKEAPLTEDSLFAADNDSENVEAEVAGFAVVTQTCDIVRSCTTRYFVEVSPLVEVDDEKLREIERGKRPNYAFIAGLADQKLVVDLDRVMTVEKPVVASWERVCGCVSDEDARRLALALARKRARFAYPDDFVELATPLIRRILSKHDKASDEGRALQALREIRVRASPSWDSDEVEVTFLFIYDDEGSSEEINWRDHLEKWMKLVEKSGRFNEIIGLTQTLDNLTARDYVESDPLDLDHLSSRA